MSRSAQTNLVSEIVSRLGGEEAIAEGLDGVITPKAVEQWWRRGRIPPERDFDLLNFAKRAGVSLSLEELSVTRRGNTSSDTELPSSQSRAPTGG